LETLSKIEKNELSLLKDCNILFTYDTKAAEIKAQLIDLRVKVEAELQKLKPSPSGEDDNPMA
jgi:hypothetical protein